MWHSFAGDLYFPYITTEDTEVSEFVCMVTGENSDDIIISRQRFHRNGQREAEPTVTLLYPLKDDTVITCTEGRQCHIRCILGGR